MDQTLTQDLCKVPTPPANSGAGRGWVGSSPRTFRGGLALRRLGLQPRGLCENKGLLFQATQFVTATLGN